MYFVDRSKYVGHFKNGMFNGYGEVYANTGKLAWSGDFVDGYASYRPIIASVSTSGGLHVVNYTEGYSYIKPIAADIGPNLIFTLGSRYVTFKYTPTGKSEDGVNILSILRVTEQEYKQDATYKLLAKHNDAYYTYTKFSNPYSPDGPSQSHYKKFESMSSEFMGSILNSFHFFDIRKEL